MRYAFIDEHRGRRPVRLQCRVPRVSPSGFYGWRRREPSERQQRREALAGRIVAIHGESRRTYGSPRVFQQLTQEGEAVSRKTVESIMRERSLRGRCRRKRLPRTTDSNHAEPVASNVLQREFTAPAPDRKWVADITYLDTEEG
jgi:transposase InsO family protein